MSDDDSPSGNIVTLKRGHFHQEIISIREKENNSDTCVHYDLPALEEEEELLHQQDSVYNEEACIANLEFKALLNRDFLNSSHNRSTQFGFCNDNLHMKQSHEERESEDIFDWEKFGDQMKTFNRSSLDFKYNIDYNELDI